MIKYFILSLILIATAAFGEPLSGVGDPNGVAPCYSAGDMYIDSDSGDVWFCTVAGDKTWSKGGGGGAFSGQENAFLVVGDSWVFSAGYDEPWASFGAYRPLLGGFTSRLAYFIGERPGGAFGASASGAVSRVHVATSFTTGGVFGPAPQFDLVKYLRAHEEVRDVLLLLGTNDYLVDSCSHGDPANPSVNPSAVCTVPETIANLKYIFDQVTALGVRAFWVLPPAWLGLNQNANSPGAATYQDAIEDVYGALVTYCSGKLCYPIPDLYDYWCEGTNLAPDRTGGNCTNLNNYDFGDGAGGTNKNNDRIAAHEDAIFNQRTGGTGLGALRRHPSAWGYQKLFAELAIGLKAADPTITQRHTGLAYDWTAIPAIPQVATSNLTATSVDVKPTRGTSVNGLGLGTHECLLAACKYVCWATCIETATDSTDPACWDGAETPTIRHLGSPSGAGHSITNGSNINTMRDYIELSEGETGTLTPLASATNYAVACVAVSPTNVSHPGVRNILTP